MIARLDLVRENLELLDQDRRLDGVEARGKADADIVVFVAALAVHAQAAQGIGHISVVGKHRAAVAIAAERLCGEEAGGGRVAESAEPAVIVDRAEGLRGIVENKQVFRLSRRSNRIVIGRQPEQIDRDDRLRL